MYGVAKVFFRYFANMKTTCATLILNLKAFYTGLACS